VAELVDALASGVSVLTDVGVQVPPLAPKTTLILLALGITQWSLRRPGALQGEIAIAIPAHVRLVMVANDLPALTDPLVSDVLRALTVSPDQVLQLTPEKIAMLPQGSRCNSWRLGTDEPLSLEGASPPLANKETTS
jgi:DNA polymerase III subunit psi